MALMEEVETRLENTVNELHVVTKSVALLEAENALLRAALKVAADDAMATGKRFAHLHSSREGIITEWMDYAREHTAWSDDNE